MVSKTALNPRLQKALQDARRRRLQKQVEPNEPVVDDQLKEVKKVDEHPGSQQQPTVETEQTTTVSQQQSEEESSSDPSKNGLSGLANLGNTCYLNSAIQALSHTIPLTNYLIRRINLDQIDKKRKSVAVLNEYRRLIYALWSNHGVVAPRNFIKVFSIMQVLFRGTRQQDSHECLTFLIDMLHQSLAKEVEINARGTPVTEFDKLMLESIKSWKACYEKDFSPIIQLFFSQLRVITQCPLCHYTTHNFEPANNLSLEIPNGGKSTSAWRDGDTITLADCLKAFTEAEELDQENMWKCDKCEQSVQARRKMNIWRPANVLILQLKRFDWRRRNSVKINCNIPYPEELDITPFIEGIPNGSPKYRLYAVINHTGAPQGGHYFSYCKHTDGNWYNFNDTGVTPLQPGQQISPLAYILFYQRVE